MAFVGFHERKTIPRLEGCDYAVLSHAYSSLIQGKDNRPLNDFLSDQQDLDVGKTEEEKIANFAKMYDGPRPTPLVVAVGLQAMGFFETRGRSE